ncbi:MAG: hypothetical protein AseanaTS_11950 [Candidatus Pelagadaptatus aseana]|uniref:sensor domain-containing phosphodiesterase n=1 Tax=Candidatus Pelagadaptatus aseana TaxID=3120508 RepID=UPI0039B1C793
MVIDENVVSVVSRLSRRRGGNLLDNITSALAEVVDADHTFIARINANRTLATTEAYFQKGKRADNFSYDLEHTPCAIVTDNRVCCHNGNVQACFPDDQMLIDMRINSYVGTPLHDSHGNVFGIIVALYEGKIDNEEAVCSLFTLFSGLIAGDIERREKQQSLNLSQAIISEMEEAVVITNDQYEIVSCNKAFTDLTGYTAEEAQGQKTNLLKSGQQDDNFYQRFWSAINEHGHWEGEIYNRKKSGELYPEYMRVQRITEPVSNNIFYLAIHKDITDLNQAREEAFFNKNFDNLTHLPNRQLFLDRLDQLIKQENRSHHRCAVMLIDLDGYQGINSIQGHNTGNQLLQLLARRLQNQYRSTDLIGHLGSDEFVLALSGLDDNLGAQPLAEELLELLRQPFTEFDDPITISGTIGISLYPEDCTNAEQLLAKADQAMQHAKSKGKDRYEFFTSHIQQANTQRLKLKKQLAEALDQRELEAAFQPIICARTGQITKLEALARWNSPDGLVSPAEFVPIAEDFGLCHLLGNLILQQSCTMLETLNSQGHQLSISVNRSIAEFKELNHDISSWLEIIEHARIDNEQISFEITESLLASEQDRLREALHQLKNANCPILLDDFGTGYSSLSYLHSFPIDFLKIDRSFVNNMADSIEARSLIKSIIAMSQALGIKTVAEGIENKRQLAILSTLGCDYYQGFYFSKPLFANELIEYLNSYSPDPTIFS